MKTTRMRVGALATLCAVAGAGAGIAGSTAATSTTKAKPRATAKQRAAAQRSRRIERRGLRPGWRHHGGPPVHEEAVVLNKAGTAFVTQTTDTGIVKSVSTDGLVITEGTPAVPYKDATVAVPADATITRNGQAAKLADIKAGDHVRVSSSPDGTDVFAADATFRPPFGPGHHGGPGDDDGDGPPPPAPPAPAAP